MAEIKTPQGTIVGLILQSEAPKEPVKTPEKPKRPAPKPKAKQ